MVLIRGRQIVPNIREGVYTECRVLNIISNRALGGTFFFVFCLGYYISVC